MQKQLISLAQVIKFCKISSSRGALIPNSPLRTPLLNTNYQPSKLAYRIENTINATTQQFINANISGCALKQGSKTHITASEQFTAAKWGCADDLSNASSRAWKCVAEQTGAHPGLLDRILQNYTRIENAHEVCKKTFNFLLCKEVQQTFSFPFSLLRD